MLDNIIDSLYKADGRTLPFSVLFKSSGLSRREILCLLDGLERKGILSHTIDFWGDPKSYILLVNAQQLKDNHVTD